MVDAEVVLFDDLDLKTLSIFCMGLWIQRRKEQLVEGCEVSTALRISDYLAKSRATYNHTKLWSYTAGVLHQREICACHFQSLFILVGLRSRRSTAMLTKCLTFIEASEVKEQKR